MKFKIVRFPVLLGTCHNQKPDGQYRRSGFSYWGLTNKFIAAKLSK